MTMYLSVNYSTQYGRLVSSNTSKGENTLYVQHICMHAGANRAPEWLQGLEPSIVAGNMEALLNHSMNL